MAKKKAGSDGFSMAQAIRTELEANSALTMADCREAILAKNPGIEFKQTSFGVAFSNARKKLGLKPLRGGGKKVRRAKPSAAAASRPAAAVSKPAASGKSVSFEHLQAARKCVAEIGDAENAIAAIQQLQTLQLG